MNPKPNSATPNPDALQQHVKQGVAAHRMKVRVLSTLTIALGLTTTITSLILAWNYPMFILPKQREMLAEAGQLVDQFNRDAAATAPSENVDKQIGRLLALEIQTSNHITAGTAIVAVAVGLLGLSTLILSTVVILNRRVTLNQINTSLAQISSQLRELPLARSP